jgi:hypothetical protein
MKTKKHIKSKKYNFIYFLFILNPQIHLRNELAKVGCTARAALVLAGSTADGHREVGGASAVDALTDGIGQLVLVGNGHLWIIF